MLQETLSQPQDTYGTIIRDRDDTLAHPLSWTRSARAHSREKGSAMIVTTTPSVEGYRITGYYGIVFGEVVSGVDFIRDFGASVRNFVGGRSRGYEDELISAREDALREMSQRASALGAHAVVGVDVDYEVLGEGGSNMLMVTASGTAVTLEKL